jgi:uncharacterized membrane protein YtjA (UPF0391 family)
MSYWSAAFVLIACVSGFIGLNDLAGVSGQLAWGLCLTAVMLAILSLLLNRKQDPAPLHRAGGESRRNLNDA